MNLISILFLAVIQGITEFLPVSSSGHLVIFRHYFNINENGMAIDVAFHFGTLFSIIVFFKHQIKELFIEAGKETSIKKNPLLFIFLGILPASIVGFFLEEKIEIYFSNFRYVFIFLFITGCILFSTRKIKDINNSSLNIKKAIFIGIFQTFALLPGISRAGLTISSGIHLNLSRKDSAHFSFIMAIPLLIGAAFIKCGALLHLPFRELKWILLGTFIAFLSGLLALKILMKILSHEKLHLFSWYLWSIAIVGFGYYFF